MSAYLHAMISDPDQLAALLHALHVEDEAQRVAEEMAEDIIRRRERYAAAGEVPYDRA